MAYEEKRAWIVMVASLLGYTGYLIVLAGRAPGVPVGEIAYQWPLIISIVASIIASIVLSIIVGVIGGITRGSEGHATDQRDREIGRFGDHIGQSFVVIGAVAAIILAMLELPYFWIANAVYLAFLLSGLLGGIAKIMAYRKGYHQW